MNFLAQLITWINVPINALAKILLAPVAVLPGWLSNTIISAIIGVAALIMFKYTSNQNAIGKVKDNIKANMLALKLFKDSMAVTLESQGRVFRGAFLLLFHLIRPMLVMMVPVCLLIAQMALWYQARPLLPTEETIVVMQLNGDSQTPWPEINIEPTLAMDITMGPVKVLSKRQVYWKIKAVENGKHHINFKVDGRPVEKQLVVGEGFMRVSTQRPSWNFVDILEHPWEKPFGHDSTIQSIAINYPDRISKTSGTNYWLIYFFIASIVFALIFKPFLKVNIF